MKTTIISLILSLLSAFACNDSVTVNAIIHEYGYYNEIGIATAIETTPYYSGNDYVTDILTATIETTDGNIWEYYTEENEINFGHLVCLSMCDMGTEGIEDDWILNVKDCGEVTDNIVGFYGIND